MTVRGLSLTVGLALIVAGCGGSQRPSRDAAVHLDGKRTSGDYVVEADASGARFLVPTAVLAGQGGEAFDVAVPTSAVLRDPKDTLITGAPPFRTIVASDTAVVPHSAHLEVLATGSSGHRFELTWEETCWSQQGANAGGSGREVLRSPAVTIVRMPSTHGAARSCYVAASAAAETPTAQVRLTIIDY